MHVNKVKDWGSDGSQRDKGIPLVASKATLKILLSKVAKSKSTSTTVSRNRTPPCLGIVHHRVQESHAAESRNRAPTCLGIERRRV